jgi:hypothetical protein
MKNLISILVIPVLICLTSYTHPKKNDTVKGKMYFSNQPFTTGNTGSKKTFTSADYIYGRIELDGKTVKEAFKVWDPSPGYPYSYLLYRVYIFHNDQELGHNTLNICLLKEEDKNKTWLNFDVLPEPVKASTVISGIERFDAGLFAAPLYNLINSNNFKHEGEYRIVVKFYYESYDVWGNREELEKWPKLEDEFTFVFTLKDVPMIKKNEQAADAVIVKNAPRWKKKS